MKLTNEQIDFLQQNIRGLAAILQASCIGLELAETKKRLYGIQTIDIPFCRYWLRDAFLQDLPMDPKLELLNRGVDPTLLSECNDTLLLHWTALAVVVFKKDLFY